MNTTEKMKRALVFVALLAVACGGENASAPPGPVPGAPDRGASASRERTVPVSYSTDIAGVNELLTAATPIQTALIYFALYLPLVDEMADYETGPPTIEPRLAESWEFSPIAGR